MWLPAGVFIPKSLDGDFLMFAAGSALRRFLHPPRGARESSGRVRLLYANRGRASVIFRTELTRLSREHPIVCK